MLACAEVRDARRQERDVAVEGREAALAAVRHKQRTLKEAQVRPCGGRARAVVACGVARMGAHGAPLGLAAAHAHVA